MTAAWRRRQGLLEGVRRQGVTLCLYTTSGVAMLPSRFPTVASSDFKSTENL